MARGAGVSALRHRKPRGFACRRRNTCRIADLCARDVTEVRFFHRDLQGRFLKLIERQIQLSHLEFFTCIALLSWKA